MTMRSNDHPGRTVLWWVATVIVGGVLAAVLLPNSLSQDIHLTDQPASERAAALMAQRLAPASDMELFVVTSNSSTVDDAGFRALVERLQSRLEALGPTVVTAAVTFYETKDPSFVSKDQRATIVPTILAGTVGDAPKKIPALRKVAAQSGASGFDIYLAGNASVAEEVTRTTQKTLESGGTIGFVIALVLLAVAMGSVVAVSLPIAVTIAVSAVAVALVAVVGQLAPFMALAALGVVVVGLAVAITQSTFVVSRYRQERAKGLAPPAAAAVAGATGGRFAVYCGAAVCLGLVPMLFVPANVVPSVAGGMIFVVAAATVAALTLVPALLTLLGDRVDRIPVQLSAPPADAGNRLVGGIAGSVVAAPAVYLVIGLAVLVAGASQWGQLRLGTPSATTLPAGSQAAHAIGVLAVNFPTLVPPVDIVVDAAATDPGVAAGIRTLTARLGEDQLFGPATVTNGKGIVLIAAPLFADPTSDVATSAVERVRADYVTAAFHGVTVYVGGPSAGFKDQADAANRYFPPAIALALILLFLVLVVALRSVALALVAVVFNLLMTGTALGLTALVFQHGVGAGVLGFPAGEHVFAWIPLLVYCALFALSVSSFILLTARIRERYDQGVGPREAVVSGMRTAGGSLTAASLVLLPVLVAIMAAPNAVLQQGAFATFAGLVVDALVVRLFLVPAATALLGKGAWYLPGWLQFLTGGAVAKGSRTGPGTGSRTGARTDFSGA